MQQLRRHLPVWMLLLIPIAVLLSSYADGPPPARTAAPGELSCFNGYCHSSFLANSGPGQLSLAATTGDTLFIPGQTVALSVALSDSGKQAFGFSISARHAVSGHEVGSWVLPNDGQQLKSEDGRQYLMHDSAQVQPDQGSWALQWQAPDTLLAPVTFYLAAVGANGDGTRQGDHVYTRRQTFTADSLSASLVPTAPRPRLRWYQEASFLYLPLPQPGVPAHIEVWDMQGRQLWGNISVGENARIQVSPWPAGYYLVKIQQGDQFLAGKVQIR